MRQRSSLPPHLRFRGTALSPGQPHLQGPGEESGGNRSRYVILQVEIPGESESRLSGISLLVFLAFHWVRVEVRVRVKFRVRVKVRVKVRVGVRGLRLRLGLRLWLSLGLG